MLLIAPPNNAFKPTRRAMPFILVLFRDMERFSLGAG
jgi:hypothetical protein